MKKIFWLDSWGGSSKGGIYYRAFDLMEFIKKVEATHGEVVGIAFEEGNHNIELITKVKR